MRYLILRHDAEAGLVLNLRTENGMRYARVLRRSTFAGGAAAVVLAAVMESLDVIVRRRRVFVGARAGNGRAQRLRFGFNSRNQYG